MRGGSAGGNGREKQRCPRGPAYAVGINLGDILIEGEDILGDGVNIAARLEGIAEPGGICISSAAYDQVHDKVPFSFIDLGDQTLKNITRAVRAYRIATREMIVPEKVKELPRTAGSVN